MSAYDVQYLSVVEAILAQGYHAANRTETRTLKLPHQVMRFDLAEEFPILTTKKVAFRTAVKELLWIYKDQSNDVRALQTQNVKIWDEWAMKDGTIGTSYGFVVKQYAQMDKLLRALTENPQDRRMIIDLWQIPYLDSGALYPCCFLTMWDVSDGRLNCALIQRSGDMGLGVPFNTTQYAVLVHLLAQVTGHKPGIFTHFINNAHIYENHIDALKLQLSRKNAMYEAPVLRLNPDVKDFYRFTPDDIELVGYRYHDKIKMEVSV